MQTPLECYMNFSDFNKNNTAIYDVLITILFLYVQNPDGSHDHLLLTLLKIFNKSLNQKYILSDIRWN